VLSQDSWLRSTPPRGGRKFKILPRRERQTMLPLAPLLVRRFYFLHDLSYATFSRAASTCPGTSGIALRIRGVNRQQKMTRCAQKDRAQFDLARRAS